MQADGPRMRSPLFLDLFEVSVFSAAKVQRLPLIGLSRVLPGNVRELDQTIVLTSGECNSDSKFFSMSNSYLKFIIYL